MVELHINNVKTKIKNLTDIKIIDAISRKLTYRLDSAKFSWEFKAGYWDGNTRLLTKHLYFPTGCLNIVTEVLQSRDIPFKLVDNREFYDIIPSSSNWQGYDLYPYQNEIVDIALDKKGGMIKAATGCHSPGTKVIMFDGSLKSVEDIKIGDKLMGPDSLPRTVLKLYSGQDDMYKIIPSKGGNPFNVNGNHILNLKATSQSARRYNKKTEDQVINISVNDYLKKNNSFKNTWKLHRAKQINWGQDKNVPTDPWVLGSSLKNSTKSIPDIYKFNSETVRLKLLAGLIDSNGHLKNNSFEICLKSKQIINDIAFVARSLAFNVSNSIENVNNVNYFKIKISGDINRIPTSILTKQAKYNKQKNNHLETEFKVEYLGKGEFYGFQLDKDHLYLLKDFTITHNSGKSLMLSRIVYEYNLPTVIYVVSLDLLSQMKNTLESCLGVPIGMVGNGVCDIQKITVCSAWTAGRVFSKNKKDKEKKEEDVVEDKWSPSNKQASQIKDMVENAQLVMLDEAQFAAASSIRAILNNSKSASYRYGLSGTPWRSGGDDLLLEAAFGNTICNVTATELIYKGYLVPPKIAFRDVRPPLHKLPRDWATVKSKFMIKNKLRNKMLVDNTVALLEMGRKPLILFREHSHGKILESMLPTDIRYRYVTGENSKQERDQIRDDFKNGDVDLILASTVYDQGVDLPALDALVLAGGGKSTAKALQRIGRVIRGNPSGNKKDAIVVETYDQSHYVKKHSIIRYQIYKTEPAFKLKMGPAMAKYVKKYKP